MKNLTIGLLLMSSVYMQAQTQVSYSPQSSTMGASGVTMISSRVNSDNAVAGSTYLFKDWNNPAKIYTDNGKVISVDNINFNAKNYRFSSKISKDSVFTFYSIYKVEIRGKRFENVGDKFYEVLYEFDDHQMLLKEYVVEVKPELHKITNIVVGPGKYQMKDELYIYNNEKLVRFWPKKKSVLKVVDSQKALVVKEAKNRNLSYKKEDDIVEIFKYYDSLK